MTTEEKIQKTLTDFANRQRISLARERKERLTKVIIVALLFLGCIAWGLYEIYVGMKPY
jgi:hypothetical protein